MNVLNSKYIIDKNIVNFNDVSLLNCIDEEI